jgi:hypothetical protein
MGSIPFLFPAPALPVSGSKGMISARLVGHPHCEFRHKSNYFLIRVTFKTKKTGTICRMTNNPGMLNRYSKN